MSNITYAERYAACLMAKGRFNGRAELTRWAKHSPTGLVRLERALGLPTPGEQWAREEEWRREHKCIAKARRAGRALARALAKARLEARANPDGWIRESGIRESLCRPAIDAAEAAAVDARARRRQDRTIAKPLVANRFLLRQLIQRAVPIIRLSGLRRAKNCHDIQIVLVEPGKEGAKSSSRTAWSADVGMSRAYCRKAYRVTTSMHRFFLSAVPRLVDGKLYLSDTVRVRQGRGTSLVVERLVSVCGALKWEAK